ncbi:tetratricopeptide repeat protein [Streptomyces sp. NPDC044571]|uniref:tetratricopeptide repeat protein n=1 Tax=Streptomyces sp. NPDC044571 TaxID=3155371 RepID=UPI0033C3E615
MAGEDEAGRRAARERGAEVLRDLLARAGSPAPAELARRSQLVGQPISDQSVSNLLAARTAARTRTVDAYIAACLHRQDDNPKLAGERGAAGYWKDRFEDASGRGVAPEAGMVRIGRPPTAADAFVKRPELAPVAEAVEAGQSVVLTHRRNDPVRERVLSGLGGVGKTQLAAQYARQVWQDRGLELIIWVSARDPYQVVTSYAQAAARLLGADATEPEQAAARLMEWLSVTSRRWLIVLDDVQLPTEVQPWWPGPTEAGQVIVTTRYRGESLWREGRRVVEVGIYSAQEAQEFLLDKLARHSRLWSGEGPGTPPEQQVAALAEDLGRLPLALSHAAAYLIQEGKTVGAYRAEFAEYRTRLEDLFPRPAEFPDPYQDPVETTWAISLDLASRLVPGGVVPAVMLLVSLLDPAGIPRDLITADTTAHHLAELVGRDVQAQEVHKALRVLHRLNLLTDDEDDPWREVKVHALVQRATREAARREPAAAQTWRGRVRAVADALVTLGNERFKAGLQESLRLNARALAGHGGAALWDPDGHTLLFGLGASLGRHGDVHGAAAHFKELAATAAEHLGADHLDTLLARGHYATWLAASGHPALAAEERRQVIADRTRAWGEEDVPENLNDRANLATHLGEAGDTAAAVRGFEDLVERRTRIHGADHPHTLVSRGNLARWRGEAGDIPAAISALAELVPLYEQAFGVNGPETLSARSNIASWRGELNPAAGLAELRRLLPVEVRVYGAADSRTLATRRNIAMLLGKSGHIAHAVAEFTVLIADYERFLDADHPGALSARRDLVDWLITAGDLPRALPLLRDLLADQARVLGPGHGATAETRRFLEKIEFMLRRYRR